MTTKAFGILIFLILSFQSLRVGAVASEETSTQTAVPTTYNLELSRWNIYSDGTHPIETTNGINKALQWAHSQGYRIFKVPTGKYLISKGNKPNDPQAQINMVSNMTFLLDESTIIQKETNGFEGYQTIYIGYGANNVTLKGGTYQGDKQSHNFSGKDQSYSYGTHEFGMGIISEGAYNLTIDGVRTVDFTGDGITISGSNAGIANFDGKSYGYGDIDNMGNFINSTSKVRSKIALDFTSPKFKGRKYFAFEQPLGVNSKKYDVYYYSNGKYLSSVKQVRFGLDLVQIPVGADTFYPVFSSIDLNNFFVKFFTNDVSRNVIIKNSESAFNRRQGISIFGVDGIEISNNKFHDIKGTAPQFGIDSEAQGFYPNNNLIIKNNHFYNNTGGDIVFADGDTASITDNLFESKRGFYIWKAFPNTTITNNTFNNADFTMGGTGVADQNKFSNSRVDLTATSNTFTNATLVDSTLNLNNTEPFGSKVDNITITNTNTTSYRSLNVGQNPVHLSNITIKGLTKLSTLQGKGTDKNIYDNLIVQDFNAYNGTVFPAGTYNNCNFSSTTTETVGLVFNQPGKYTFNNCTFNALSKIFTLDSLYGEPDVNVNNSNFTISKDIGYAAAIYLQGAKQLSLLNSTFTANNLTLKSKPFIKIGPPGGFTKPAKVKSFTIKNSTIKTNIDLDGIHTIDAGTGAPAYTISNNIFVVAKLKLKASDINIENKELAK